MGSKIKSQLFLIIDELRDNFPLKCLFSIAEVSRAGYYKWKHSSKRITQDEYLRDYIKAVHEIRPYYGYRRICVLLQKEGLEVTEKQIYRIAHKYKLFSIIRKKRKYFGKKGSIIYNNLLDRNFKTNNALAKLSTDITFIPVGDSFLYLSVILDLYNNEVLSHKISERNDIQLVLDTINQIKKNTNAILHSDQGHQYTSKAYQEKLKKYKLLGSHSRVGNCLDNACVESFFSHLKQESQLTKQDSKEENIRKICEYITFYNTRRFQKRLGYFSPVEFRERMAA